MHVYEDMNQILDRLYLGNCWAAEKKEQLKAVGITHIVVVGIGLERYHPEDFEYLGPINVNDDSSENLLEHFDSVFEFITNGMKKGAVYVHCAAGVSRSATIVIGYIMHMQKIDFETAFKFVKQRRPAIFPNSGFVEQLKLFQELEHKVDVNHEKYIKFLEEKKKQQEKQRELFSMLEWKFNQ